ncbi:MAG TPA: C40 family peptidase, partial [Paludibacter sp.]
MPLQRHILLFLGFIFSILLSVANAIDMSATDSISASSRIDYLSASSVSITDSIINYGKQFLNRPYRYGSAGADTFDCSGFTSYVYRNFGYNLEHSSAEQAQQFDTVKRTHLKTGDLVFFAGSRKSKRVGHVGIVTTAGDDGKFSFIHASCDKGVTISSSEEPYYSRRFIKANRVIGGT